MHNKIQRALSLLAFTALCALGGTVTVSANEDSTSHQAHKQQDWPGVYYGFLPCADCVGIKTTLALNKNGSYLTITQYAGKSEREFTEKGRYEWSEQDGIITLTPRKGGTASQRYLVEANRLIQLDAQGKRVTGELAERYVLRRKDMSETAPSNGGHGGH